MTPASASTRMTIPGLDPLRPDTGADDGRQAVLTGDDRRVAHHPADVQDGAGDRAEDGRPARRGGGRDQDLALEQGAGSADRGARELGPRRPRATPTSRSTARSAVLRRQPLADALRRDPPEHYGDRLGDHPRVPARARAAATTAASPRRSPSAARRSAASATDRRRPRRRCSRRAGDPRARSGPRRGAGRRRPRLVEEPFTARSAPNSRTLFQKIVR